MGAEGAGASWRRRRGGPGGAAVQVEAEAGLRPRDRRWAGRGAQVSAERAGGERRRRGAGGGSAGPDGPTALSVRRERRTHRYRPGARSPAPVSRAVPVLRGGAGAARCAPSRVWLTGRYGRSVPGSRCGSRYGSRLRFSMAPFAPRTGSGGDGNCRRTRTRRRARCQEGGGWGLRAPLGTRRAIPGLRRRRWITGHRDASPPLALTVPALPVRRSGAPGPRVAPSRGSVAAEPLGKHRQRGCRALSAPNPPPLRSVPIGVPASPCPSAWGLPRTCPAPLSSRLGMTPDGTTGAALMVHPIPGSLRGGAHGARPPHTPPFGHPELCGLCPAPSSVLCSPRAAAPAAVCPGRGAVFTLTPNNGCCLGLWLPLTGGLFPFGVRGCGAALFGYPGPLLASSSGCRLWVRCLRVESRRASVSHSRARPVALWAQLPHGGWGSYGLGSPPVPAEGTRWW